MKTIKATPTWRALLPVMLEVSRDGCPPDIRREFERMAEAADLWNQHAHRLGATPERE